LITVEPSLAFCSLCSPMMLSRTVFIVTLASAAVSQAERLGKSSKSKSDQKTNVYGKPLSKCSQTGMALTGFTRTGRCVEEKDDEGSHHICIDLSSESLNGKNFCEVTKQDDWCDSKMECDDGGSDKKCPVEHWCVCQWAFEGYLEKAGGCDSIQEIDCEATNNEAILAYQADEEEHGEALACLKKRCNLDGAVVVATE